MTGRQLQREFEMSASTFNEFKPFSFKGNEINYFLNEAQNVCVNKRLEQISNKTEDKQKSINELTDITVKDITLVKDVGSSTTERDVYDFPNGYLYLINDRSNTLFCGATKFYDNRLTKLENLYKILEHKYSSTIYKSPVSAISSNKLYIYKDGNFTISGVTIDYIRTYTDIDVIADTTSELNPNIHKEIVQLAVAIALENISSGRFQSNVSKNIITEQIK